MTWTCPNCGHVSVTEEESKRHICQGKITVECNRCRGTGRIVQSIGPAITCPTCNGKGRI